MKDQSIFKIVKRENPFVQVDKNLINDENLTWKTKGILIYLLSKPNDWQARVNDIVKHAKDGRDAVRSAIKEAIETGYIKRIENRNELGQFKGFIYQVFEISAENGNSEIGKSDVGKPDITNIDNTNTDNINKEKKENKYNTSAKNADEYKIFNDYINGIESKHTLDCENGDIIIIYFEKYRLLFNKPHPSLINGQMRKIIWHINNNIENVLLYRDIDDLIENWFTRKDNYSDYNINAFIAYIVELDKKMEDDWEAA